VRGWWAIIRGERGRTRKLGKVLVLLRPYRLRVIVMFVALVLATAAALAPPYLAGRAIDDGIRGGDLGALDLIVVLFLVAALVNWGATYVQTYLVNWVGQRALQDLRMRIFAHLQSLSIGFYSRNKAGVLISRMTNDVQALDQLVTDGIVTLFASSLTLVGTAAILVALDPGLALVTFTTFPVLLISSLAFRIASADAYRLTREKIAFITAYLQETLSGIRVVRAFGQEERHKERFAELNDENREANMKTVYLNAAYFPSVELLSAVATAVILLYGGSQVVSGDGVTIGVLAAFVFYLNSFFDPIQQLSQLYTTYQAGMAALDKIFELLAEKPDLVEKPGAADLPAIAGEIRFDDVSFCYSLPDEQGAAFALRDVSLTVPPGQTVALVGATGAGKSTLAKLVARFYDPTSGRVLVDGHDLRDVTEKSLRSQLGIVPQEGFLFSGTIRDNIAFGRPDATDVEVREAARAVGADEFIARLPEGYDTEVGERGGHLSAGQRQLVAFARAAVADPRVLILDEATSNVDVHTEARIERGLRRLLAGRTAIVIAHRLSTIRGAGRIVVMDGGRVVESGTHDELIAAGGAYAALYRDWAEQAAA
jgi:ATP-binding cassette subfamily B protein